jgi:ABC-type multidrug transport system fused ATPase/permease subunit
MSTSASADCVTSEKSNATPSQVSPIKAQRAKRAWRRIFRYESGEIDKEANTEDKMKASVTRGSLRRFWSFVRRHKWLVLCLCVCTLLNQAMTVVMPLAIGRVLDTVLPRMDMALLNSVAIGLAIFVVVRSGFLFLERELAVLIGSLIVRDVRTSLHEHMQKMSLRFLEDYQVGRIVSRIMGDTEAIRNLLIGGFINSASNAVRFVFVLGTLIWIDWRLTLASCVTLPIFMIGFWRNVRRLRPAYKEISEDGSRLWAKASETFSAVRVVKTYGGEKRADLSFTSRVHTILRKGLLICRTHHLIAIIWEMSVWLGLVALIWYGGQRVMAGALSAGELVAFYGLLGLLHGPVAELINVSGTVQQAMASIERIGEIMDEAPEVDDKRTAVMAGTLKGEVVFKNVGFKYKEKAKPKSETAPPGGTKKRTATLENISFDVKAGQCIALVGPSGSGKSTISNLLARFYDVDTGCISVDGVDIRDYQMKSYRRNLAIVLQDNFLFRGTIRENIAYSRPDATEDEIIAAAKMAGAWEFISASDDGLDALCGERGVKLSGGQKQRISIARAILADPRILILDEATSALDSQAEAKIQTALDTLMKGRTTFVIAHRLSTVVNADKIIVMDQGRIVEMGTHEELLGREGHYFDLFMEQYGKIRFTGNTVGAIKRWRDQHNKSDTRQVENQNVIVAQKDELRAAPLTGPLGIMAPPYTIDFTPAQRARDGDSGKADPGDAKRVKTDSVRAKNPAATRDYDVPLALRRRIGIPDPK